MPRPIVSIIKMKLRRFLVLAFAAALTVGTSTAAPVLFTAYAGTGGSQALSVTIDGSSIGSFSGVVAGGQVFSNSVEESDGWHTILIDYTSFAGTPGLTLIVNGGWVTLADLQSLNGSGTPVNGLHADYYTIGGTLFATNFGETAGGYLHYTVGSTPWNSFSATTHFEEKLTGKIYFGPDPNPALDTIHSDPPPSDPPPSDPPPADPGDNAVPEPSGLWLVAAALPLVLLSKRRFSPAKARY